MPPRENENGETMPRILHLLAHLALLGLAAAPATAQTDIGNMTPEERAAFGAEVRGYLLANPEVLTEVIEELTRRREQAQADADGQLVASHAAELYEDSHSYVAGNPEGDVTVVEFLDYNCPYCKQAHPEVLRLLEDDPNVRLVVKEFPILGPGSIEASQIAMAALEQDPESYPALYEALMSHQGRVDGRAVYALAEAAGYDVDELEEAAGAAGIDDRIKDNYQLGARLGIEGTPGFVIGDRIIRGFVPADELADAVEAARDSATN